MEIRTVNVKFLALLRMNVWLDGNVVDVDLVLVHQEAIVAKTNLAVRRNRIAHVLIANVLTKIAARQERAKNK